MDACRKLKKINKIKINNTFTKHITYVLIILQNMSFKWPFKYLYIMAFQNKKSMFLNKGSIFSMKMIISLIN